MIVLIFREAARERRGHSSRWRGLSKGAAVAGICCILWGCRQGGPVPWGGACGERNKSTACGEGLVCRDGRCLGCSTSADCTNGVPCVYNRCAAAPRPSTSAATPPRTTPEGKVYTAPSAPSVEPSAPWRR